jgi:hypothetical protein
VLHKITRLSAAEEGNLMYRIKPYAFKPQEYKTVINTFVKIKEIFNKVK